MVALRHLFEPTTPRLDVADARAEVERLRAGLPDTLLAKRPDEIRRLAREALDTQRAAERREALVGEPVVVDEETTGRAIDAHAELLAAREALRVARNAALTRITVGNAWGLTGIGAAAAMVMGGAEPMGQQISIAMLAAGAGPLAAATAGLVLRTRVAADVRRAARSWTEAMAATPFATLGELHARRLSARAWQRRRAEADAARAAAREARAAWHRVAGPAVHPREAPSVLAQVAVLRAAQLDLLASMLAANVDRLTRPPEVFVVAPDDGGLQHTGVFDRLRLRGLRLWTH